jgi:replicative DNA helicase
MASQRELPFHLEAEQSVLGALLIDGEAAAGVFQILVTDDFFSPRHGRIYDAIERVFDQRASVDEVLLQAELDRRGELESVGGIEYLRELIERVPAASSAEHYANIVRDKSMLRRLVRVCTEIVEGVYTSDSPAAEQQDRAEKKVLEIGRVSSENEFVSVGSIVASTFSRLESPDGDARSVFSGFVDLDEKTNGFKPSELIIVAGRPSMGKTSFSMSIVQHAAIQGKTIAIFSLEVARDQLVQNLLCSFAQLESDRVRKKSLSTDEWNQLIAQGERLSELQIFIDDSPGLSPMTLKAKARRLHARHPLDLIVIDYLQLMEADDSRGDSRQQEVSTISRSLKGLARELRVPVLTLSQLSRGVESREDRRPRMSDLRESGAIEQDADVILLLYRDEYYHPEREESKGKAEVILAKQRNGPTGTVHLVFIGSQLRFESERQLHSDSY